MNFLNIIKSTGLKVGFGLKKHSPEIMIVAGVVGTVVSTVMACKATTKLSQITDEHKEQMKAINDHPIDKEEYTEEDKKKDQIIVRAQTGIKIAKLYLPAVGLGVLSIVGILESNHILKRRNVALAAAYAAIDKSFKSYRDRVIDRFGKEVDRQLRFNTKETEIEETIMDEKGKEKTVKKKINIADPNLSSDYARYFTRSNPNWENNTDYLQNFFRMQQNYANDKLRAKGHITLNEVYEMLGFKESKGGMIVGWMFDLDHPTGDNYIEFDVHEIWLPNEYDGELEKAYAVDFNVDGNIYDHML